MKNLLKITKHTSAIIREVLMTYFAPIVELIIRLYMANIFFTSGLLKFKNALNGQWDSTLMLFEYVHPVPFLPTNIAAIAGTAGEIILPVLLALGLFGRIGAAGLFVMTVVIQYGVPAEYELSNPEHYFWMMLLGVIITRGAGKISVDELIIKRFFKG